MKRRIFSLLLAVLWSMTLMGCGQETVPMDVDFVLPESFLWETGEDGIHEIIRNDQIVGGLVKTSLTKADVLLPAGTEGNFRDYLESYVQPPLVMEYMAGSGKDNVLVEVDLIAYNTETQTAHEVSHYFFEKNGAIYDLWLDPELVDSDAEIDILKESGLYLSEE